MKNWTHGNLVTVAAKWLRNNCRCHAVLAELNLVNGQEIPDAIGWDFRGRSVMVEVKVSRSDFLADKEKKFRQVSRKGMGLLRYYMAPKGMLKPEDLTIPDGDDKIWNGWGLLEVGNAGQVFRTMTSQKFLKHNQIQEMCQLVGALRRVQTRLGQEPLWEFIKNWSDPLTPEDKMPQLDVTDEEKKSLAWLLNMAKPQGVSHGIQ